ncbi:hypothetical protein O181_044932 [Austropuccinia psidii MF-1]|uniref:Uncharacterized protein n=1 Tax=Austropuccinia psidii MF-1 TaxID=1389203 RepID=A0A9Q3DST3_9BASI|nr:hypothetical protein [Austropuccinia psidii MF-1]
MPEPQRTDGGGTEGEDSVSSVISERMAKDGAGRRIQGIRIIQFKPESSSMNKAIIQLWPPINHLRPPLQHGGSSESYGPGPSQWTQALWVKVWSMAILMVPWTPWNPGICVQLDAGGL